MLCLSEDANCVLMNCGHSSMCFNCAIRLAIKDKQMKKNSICHLCREEICYALKIDLESIMNKENNTWVKILSYIDFKESLINEKIVI